MKQVLQNLRTGETEVADVPAPGVARGSLLIRSTCSLISTGTERMLVEFGKAGLLGKARQQPDRVKAVLDKVRTDGLLPTIDAVRNKLDQPLALGYCNVGEVVEVGAGVDGFTIGDRVVSNAKHAEIVSVPANLCARIPVTVADDTAAFTVLGSIALQGIRLLQPTLGEAIVVTGLGLIGQLAVQLLRANGCRVLGLDFDAEKVELARHFGAEAVQLGHEADPVRAAESFSRGRGVDGVLITASTSSNEPVHQAALMCRQRGRIVLVGVAGLELSRDDFYKKELTFQVSCSYGPGRYDPAYEDKGQDYPVGFVRWTENRNFEAVLDMMSGGRVDTNLLVSHRFDIADAARAYALVSGDAPTLGILLRYPRPDAPAARVRSIPVTSSRAHMPSGAGAPSVSVIGSGNYATAVLIPAFKEAGARLRRVASHAGVSSLHAARKFGFEEATTDVAALLADASVDAVTIATRHDSHAALVIEALHAGKSVFVEKPLCLTLDELARITALVQRLTASGKPPRIMVGFNRRFAPHTERIHQLLAGVRGPFAFVMTVNAGAIPAIHWTQDPVTGGGRILGEGCHFIDLLRLLAGSPISAHELTAMSGATRDTATIQLRFENGSIGTVHYLANGSRAYPKERLEIFASGGVLQLDNWRRLAGFGWPGFTSMRLWRQDKGQRGCASAFLRSVAENAPSPIPFDEIAEVSRVAIELAAQ